LREFFNVLALSFVSEASETKFIFRYDITRDERTDMERKQFWYLAVLALGVLLFVALIQVTRVNKPRPEPQTKEAYTSRGPLIQDDLKIAANDFHATRINLNRRGKITGKFRTESVKLPVTVLVINEENFNKWKVGENYGAVIQTGSVPGGQIAPVLEPGVYFLVIDNRNGDKTRSVWAEFSLE
jgi:hypothetical protein